MERVINSRNLFIDTDRGTNSRNTKGDDYEIDLNNEGITAGDGQQIRLTVNEFAMAKSWTNINDNNNQIDLIYRTVSPFPLATTTIALQPQNYEFIRDIGQELADKMAASVVSSIPGVSTCTVSNLLPDAAAGINGTTDNRISFKLTTDVAHGLTALQLICDESKGDSYEIIGGNRLIAPFEATASSVSVDVTTTANEIVVQCYYPAQRASTSYIYLRTSVATNSIETSSLHSATGQENTNSTLSSNILCRIPVNSEYCIYNANTGREYFVDLAVKHLNHMRLFLTDEHNRPIARRTLLSNTASRLGLGYQVNDDSNQQATRGNLNFSAVIRLEIIQKSSPHEQMFPKAQNPVPARNEGIKLYPNRNPI
jgi:hypothetical protein